MPHCLLRPAPGSAESLQNQQRQPLWAGVDLDWLTATPRIAGRVAPRYLRTKEGVDRTGPDALDENAPTPLEVVEAAALARPRKGGGVTAEVAREIHFRTEVGERGNDPRSRLLLGELPFDVAGHGAVVDLLGRHSIWHIPTRGSTTNRA